MKLAHCLIPGVAFVSACGGSSERNGGLAGAASGAGSFGGAQAAGGANTTGGNATTSGAATTGGSEGRDYVPDHPNQPAQGDGRVTGGSFEQTPGFGWDTCFSKYPGGSYASGVPAGSDGEHCFTFDSRRACAESPACQPAGGDAQFGFWLDSVVTAGDAVHLYFDVTNLEDAQPDGEIGIDAVGSLCESTEVLARIPLAALGLDTSWQTRCASFVPTAPFQIFGVHVTGASFHVGLDAFRFGPPCHD
jgi:hypothetical protein